MLQKIQIKLQGSWQEQVERWKSCLQKQDVDFVEIHTVDELKKIDPIQTAHMILLTDDQKAAQAWKSRGGICIGCTQENTFFEGAELVTDSLEELDAVTLEETLLHGLGLPVTAAQTERLIIREITEAEVEDLYQLSLQKEMRYLFADEKAEYSRENCFAPERMLPYIKSVYRFCGYGLWSVWTKSGKLIGCCGLSDMEEELAVSEKEGFNLEIQYMLAPEVWKQGYAFEMCTAVLQYAFERLGCKMVLAKIHRDNTPSIRLAEKLGFVRCGAEAQTILKYKKIVDAKGNLYYNKQG